MVDDYLLHYYFDDEQEGFWDMTIDYWKAFRGNSENCAKPLGYTTSLGYASYNPRGWSPYFGSWQKDSSTPEHPYLFSEPLPDPLPNATALNPYNQLSWFDNNVWAFSTPHLLDPGTPQLPLDQQQYGRNTLAANIRTNLAYNCSMLFNVPSEEAVSIGDGGQTMRVNLEQAAICEYPNNTMAVSLQISTENAFGFAKFAKDQLGGLEIGASVQMLEKGSFLQSELKWYPGALSGWVNLTLVSTSNVPQYVTSNYDASSCCLTSPFLRCDYINEGGVKVRYSGISAGLTNIASVPRRETAFASFKINTQQHGEGYCNLSLSQVYFDGNLRAVATDATSHFEGKITFSAPVGPPVSFTVTCYLYFQNMEFSKYFLPKTAIGPGVARPEFTDETDELKNR